MLAAVCCYIYLYSSIFLYSLLRFVKYQFLEADPDTLPAELFVTAMADGEIMAVEHEKYPVYGLQFHPESILTPKGIDILRNVVESIRK